MVVSASMAPTSKNGFIYSSKSLPVGHLVLHWCPQKSPLMQTVLARWTLHCGLLPHGLIALLFFLLTLYSVPSLMGCLRSSNFSPFMVEKNSASPALFPKLAHLTQKNEGPPRGTVQSPYKPGGLQTASITPVPSLECRYLSFLYWIINSLKAGTTFFFTL